MCEDALTDKRYFELAISAAIEYCAYLCYTFGLDISSIVSHAEAHKMGYASNHGDIDHWLKKFGWDMNGFRRSVREVYEKLYTDYASEVKKKYGFTDETIEYLRNYKYSEDLFKKLL